MSFFDNHFTKIFGGETVARASEAFSGLTSEQYEEVSGAVKDRRYTIFEGNQALDVAVQRHAPVIDTVAEVIPVPEPAPAPVPETPELPANVTPLQLAQQIVNDAYEAA